MITLLNWYKGVFAISGGLLGRTSIGTETLESPSIKQAPGRPSPHLKEKVEEEIEKMLFKGVFDPSSSPRSSP